MPRKLRIQYEGALYHVLNRGNYRRDVFESAGAAQSFIEAMEEVSERYDWRIHAYVLMRNHYHLIVETPKVNLVDGMHWLQSTVATRFNRFRNERGHLFQGRYQAILLEDFSVVARVADYIHLNPVRAGIVATEQALRFRWSSLPRFVKNRGFAQLIAQDWLPSHGLANTPSGWKLYLDHLTELAGNSEEQKKQGFAQFSRGWAIGTKGWRKALAQEHAHRVISPGIEAQQLRELNEARWGERLKALLAASKRSDGDAKAHLKSAPWKLSIAQRLRREEGASHRWIADALQMGKPSALRSYLCRHDNQQKAPWPSWHSKTVSNTSQIRAQKEVAATTDREHVIVTGEKTHVTGNAAKGSKVIRRKDLGPDE